MLDSRIVIQNAAYYPLTKLLNSVNVSNESLGQIKICHELRMFVREAIDAIEQRTLDFVVLRLFSHESINKGVASLGLTS